MTENIKATGFPPPMVVQKVRQVYSVDKAVPTDPFDMVHNKINLYTNENLGGS